VTDAGVAAKAAKKGAVPNQVTGNTTFALDLYSHLAKGDEGNLFYSPYSISTALAMTYAGARGNTATEMEKVLHFEARQGVHSPFKELQSRVNAIGEKGKVTLNVANSLWPDRQYKFLDSFMYLVSKHYVATIKPIDFSNADLAAKLINTWVEDKTNDLIKDILKASDIDPLTKLALVNAIYFKGTWKYQFKKKQTREQDFMVTRANRVKVPLMSQAGKFHYGENKDLQVLELPYDGDDVSMVVILPRKVDGLAALEKKLNAQTLTQWTGLLRQHKKVNVFFPRFKMEYMMHMKKTLTAMGMPDAFSTVRADFSGMDGSRNLRIHKVIHKAFVEVNEEGTEAAAATVVLMAARSARIDRPPTFRADHPFIFLIKDRVTGSVLFMGRMTNPAT
jgi:serpin B